MTTQEIQNLHTVKLHKHLRIPMTDGVELDAHLFLPEEPGQFPAVFDYYPYRKDDLSAGNLRFQQYLAQLGAWVTIVQGFIFFVCVLLFRRGIVGEINALLRWHRARKGE